ncbi:MULTISPECIES: BolA family protein [Gammaproteobacteria]|uniref:BolA family protein n=1 Tax=Gammaproteobacteria TaxID=1236 RepID=UPI000DD00DF3|nr:MULTISPECIES: BolA family protein [Gammaproteobacteria]RTE86342.1 BolA family transcriptional regulator [Aliidiomarina sp. B3213]TCZ91692.1 BolA family transcriptional regulator [Lysobacter sp. N42]
METQDIEKILLEALELDEVHVKSDGSHYQVIAVSDKFAELSRVKQQQMIYGPLNDKIADGSIHALTIKAMTPDTWKRDKGLYL